MLVVSGSLQSGGRRFEFDALGASAEIEALRRACGATPCHLVGGTVRDALLGRAVVDVDVVVEADGRAIAEELARLTSRRLVDLGGDRFPSFRLVGTDRSIDLWDRQGAPLAAELARRDLTINAIAVDIGSGEVIDPQAGRRDLTARLLRAVGARTFDEDPLRIWRLARLAAQLPGFRADPETVVLARDALPGLRSVASERVREELSKLLVAPAVGTGVEMLATVGLFPRAWHADAPPGSVTRVVDAMARFAELRSSAPSQRPDSLLAHHLILAQAATTNDSGARRALSRVAERGWITERLRRRVAAAAGELPRGEIEVRRYVNRTADDWLSGLLTLAAIAGSTREDVGELVTLGQAIAPEVIDPPALVDGHELAARLGIARGPRLGELLAAISREQVDGRLHDREAALAFAAELHRRTEGEAR